MENKILPSIDIVSRQKLDTNIFNTGLYLKAIRNNETLFIGIVSSGETLEDHPLYGETNCLVLQFDDIDDNINIFGQTIRVSDEQIKMIGDFIIQNKHFNKWLVQCDAGISRSGAIGDIIAQYLEKDRDNKDIYNSFLREYCYKISPNYLVLELLKNYLKI